MPFVESRLEQRISLLSDYDTGAWSVSELCADYGIDRSTFYYWLRRRASSEEEWFVDRSRAPHGCPHKTCEQIVEAVARVRRRFRHFGPKKVRAWLLKHEPGEAWPAASTIGDILKREGLVLPRKRRHRPRQAGTGTVRAASPNAE